MTDTAPKTPDSELVDEMLTAYYGAHPSLACVQRNKRHMQAAACVLLERMREPNKAMRLAANQVWAKGDKYEYWSQQVDIACKAWPAMLHDFAREHGLSAEDERE